MLLTGVATLVLEMEMEVFKLREQVMQMRCSLILPSLDCIPDFKLLCILHVNAMLQAPAWDHTMLENTQIQSPSSAFTTVTT